MTHIVNCKTHIRMPTAKTDNICLCLITTAKNKFIKTAQGPLKSQKGSECLAENPSNSTHFETCVQRSCVVCGVLEYWLWPVTNLSFKHLIKIKIWFTVSNSSYYCSQCFWICGFKQLYTGNHSEMNTCSYEIFFTMSDTITSQNIDISSWITPYNEKGLLSWGKNKGGLFRHAMSWTTSIKCWG